MTNQNPSVRLGRLVRQSDPDLQSQLESLLDTVWQCERFERTHPFTVATIRSLAPRRRREE